MENRKSYNELYLGTILLIKAAKKIREYNNLVGESLMSIADTLTNELENKFSQYNEILDEQNSEPQTELTEETEEEKRIAEELEALIKSVKEK